MAGCTRNLRLKPRPAPERTISLRLYDALYLPWREKSVPGSRRTLPRPEKSPAINPDAASPANRTKQTKRLNISHLFALRSAPRRRSSDRLHPFPLPQVFQAGDKGVLGSIDQ